MGIRLNEWLGFDKIQNLEAYYNLSAIWLNNNGFLEIEGLDALTKLKQLYLNNNNIKRMERLGHLTQLVTLNLSHNHIERVDGLSELVNLKNLFLNNNSLLSAESIRNLTQCPSLTNLDLSDNHIEASESILDTFIALPALACLYLKGNPLGYFVSLYYPRSSHLPVVPPEVHRVHPHAEVLGQPAGVRGGEKGGGSLDRGRTRRGGGRAEV